MDAETFQRLGESAPPFLAVFDPVDRFEWVNHSWERDLGWSKSALVGTRLRDLVHEDDLDAYTRAHGESAQSAQGRTQRTRFRQRDGGYRWIDWFVSAVSQGLFYARDVTKVMIAENALDRQVQLMALAEEVAGVGNWSLDVATQNVTWSPQVFRIHGYQPNEFEVTFERAVAAYHPDDAPRVTALVGDAIENGKAFEFEVRIIRADGDLRNVISRGRCDIDPATGRTTSVFGTFLDVTERDRARDQLAREQRLVTTGMLAAGVGHEMNNPLTYICMNLDVVIEELQGIAGASPSGRLSGILESLGEAQSGATRLRKIVRGLRAFVREDAPPAPTELQSVIEQSVNMSMHEIRQRAACLIELDDVPLVEADDSRLSQVFVNLLCNAAQSFKTLDPVRNRITVRGARVGDEYVVVTVEDNGPGIAPDVLARIFEPFYTTKSAGDGTGLGLAISQSIMQSFGGDLVCDTQLGRGTTFVLTLRASQIPAAVSDASEATPGRPTQGRIVVVDDEPAVIRMMERALKQECQVTCFTDPRRALEFLRSAETVDVILCDLTMPHVTGMMLYDSIRAERPELADRFVFMSGGAPREELRVFLASVDNERLDKPFDLSQLRALVRREVNRRTNA